MKLMIALHAIAAVALITASVMTVQLVGALPAWVGVLVGITLYGLTLLVAKGDVEDET
jgi:hypothetical protein